jgi:amino acid transporter
MFDVLPGLFTDILKLILIFLPAIIAVLRDHRSMLWVIALTLLLGWFWITWIPLMLWSLLGREDVSESASRSRNRY